MIFPATALNGWSFELAGQMAAPGFDLELNLHRSQSHNGSFRMRMEAWVEVGIEFLVDSEGRLMEARKLAVLLHRLWVSGEIFKPFPQMA